MTRTSLTLTSSATSSRKGASPAGSAVAMVRLRSGWRTRSFSALRRLRAAETAARASSMAATSSALATWLGSTGQSVRCTERPPVRPRQISSLTSGASGAMTSVSTLSTVARVSKAAVSPSVKR